MHPLQVPRQTHQGPLAAGRKQASQVKRWKPITSLIAPNTVSTVALRRAYTALPSCVTMRCRARATASASAGNAGGSTSRVASGWLWASLPAAMKATRSWSSQSARLAAE